MGLGRISLLPKLPAGHPSPRWTKLQSNTPPVAEAVDSCSFDVGTSVGVSDASNYIDPAYPGPWCSQYIQTGSASDQQLQQFQNDSIISADAVLNYPTQKYVFFSVDLIPRPRPQRTALPIQNYPLILNLRGLRARRTPRHTSSPRWSTDDRERPHRELPQVDAKQFKTVLLKPAGATGRALGKFEAARKGDGFWPSPSV